VSRNRWGTVYTTNFDSWGASLDRIITGSGLDKVLCGSTRTILIKPNLVEAIAPPVTTPVALVAALVERLKDITGASVIIGEGSGAMAYDTGHSFSELGYADMARRYGVKLVDLNNEELVRLENKTCRRWPEMHLPGTALECFLISIPVLKAHSLAGVTLTMKNMMGLPPPLHYKSGGCWKKSAFHHRIQDAIADLNRYRTPDFTLLDATIGMAKAHLRGPVCDPPVNILAGGFDPVAIDAYGTGLLNRNWRDIGHIRSVNHELGLAEPLVIIPA
jgi:uncharacterized protein (DUF362 family)